MRAQIFRVVPAWGNQLLNSPNGVKVYFNASTVMDGEFFRCLFGGFIQTMALSWDTDGVWCDTPPNNGSWLSSNRPNIIQIVNDNRELGAASNSLSFLLLLDPVPVISFIAPTAADRNCFSHQTCGMIYVYGQHLTGGSSVTCSFFDEFTSEGSYAGQRRINRVLYDRISCPVPSYTTTPMTGPVYRADGFQLLINRSTSGPTASNKVGWTFTCNPCDS